MEQDELETTLDRIVNQAKQMKSEGKRYLDLERIPLICLSIVQINKDISEIKDGIKSRIDDHEARVRVLERNFYVWMGGLAICSPIATVLLGHFINK